MASKKFIKSLHDQSLEQLKEMLADHQKELYALTMKNKLRSLKQTHLIKSKRRDIARIKTILHTKAVA
jgi:large subunit ribosomal protein L29